MTRRFGTRPRVVALALALVLVAATPLVAARNIVDEVWPLVGDAYMLADRSTDISWRLIEVPVGGHLVDVGLDDTIHVASPSGYGRVLSGRPASQSYVHVTPPREWIDEYGGGGYSYPRDLRVSAGGDLDRPVADGGLPNEAGVVHILKSNGVYTRIDSNGWTSARDFGTSNSGGALAVGSGVALFSDIPDSGWRGMGAAFLLPCSAEAVRSQGVEPPTFIRGPGMIEDGLGLDDSCALPYESRPGDPEFDGRWETAEVPMGGYTAYDGYRADGSAAGFASATLRRAGGKVGIYVTTWVVPAAHGAAARAVGGNVAYEILGDWGVPDGGRQSAAPVPTTAHLPLPSTFDLSQVFDVAMLPTASPRYARDGTVLDGGTHHASPNKAAALVAYLAGGRVFLAECVPGTDLAFRGLNLGWLEDTVSPCGGCPGLPYDPDGGFRCGIVPVVNAQDAGRRVTEFEMEVDATGMVWVAYIVETEHGRKAVRVGWDTGNGFRWANVATGLDGASGLSMGLGPLKHKIPVLGFNMYRSTEGSRNVVARPTLDALDGLAPSFDVVPSVDAGPCRRVGPAECVPCVESYFACDAVGYVDSSVYRGNDIDSYVCTAWKVARFQAPPSCEGQWTVDREWRNVYCLTARVLYDAANKEGGQYNWLTRYTRGDDPWGVPPC